MARLSANGAPIRDAVELSSQLSYSGQNLGGKTMRKRGSDVLVAGLMAGVLLACAGPAAELLGDAMVDAGQALSGAGIEAGQLLADAGRTLQDAETDARQVLDDAGNAALTDTGRVLQEAGQAVSDAGDAALRDARAAELDASAPGGQIPRPVWVLRDKDGKAVYGDFSPSLADIQSRFGESRKRHVLVHWLQDRRVALEYELDTGKPTVASGGYPSWRDNPSAIFHDAQCTGPAYADEAHWNSAVLTGTDVYYVAGDPDVVDTTWFYRWNAETETCELHSLGANTSLWAFKLIPDWVADALANPPYALTLEYES